MLPSVLSVFQDEIPMGDFGEHLPMGKPSHKAHTPLVLVPPSPATHQAAAGAAGQCPGTSSCHFVGSPGCTWPSQHTLLPLPRQLCSTPGSPGACGHFRGKSCSSFPFWEPLMPSCEVASDLLSQPTATATTSRAAAFPPWLLPTTSSRLFAFPFSPQS